MLTFNKSTGTFIKYIESLAHSAPFRDFAHTVPLRPFWHYVPERRQSSDKHLTCPRIPFSDLRLSAVCCECCAAAVIASLSTFTRTTTILAANRCCSYDCDPIIYQTNQGEIFLSTDRTVMVKLCRVSLLLTYLSSFHVLLFASPSFFLLLLLSVSSKHQSQKKNDHPRFDSSKQ